MDLKNQIGDNRQRVVNQRLEMEEVDRTNPNLLIDDSHRN